MKTTHTNYFGNIKNAIGGMLFGLVLVIASVPLLFWNEGRAVDRSKSLDEGKGSVVSLNNPVANPGSSDKLVHVTGEVNTTESPADSFGVSANAIAIIRTVESYQWVEDSNTVSNDDFGGGTTTTTTYTHTKEWSERQIDSSLFGEPIGHENPVQPYTSSRVDASVVKLGELSINQSLINKLPKTEGITVDPASYPNLPAGLTSQGQYLTSSTDINAPNIGDLRISYSTVPPQTVSIIAGLYDDQLSSYNTKNGSIELLSAGKVSAENMFTEAEKDNAQLTWALRGGGSVAMFTGFSLLMGVIPALARIIPFGKSVTGFAVTLVALAATAIIAPLVVSIAWFAHRPVIGIGIIAGGIAVFLGVTAILRQRKSKLQQAS